MEKFAEERRRLRFSAFSGFSGLSSCAIGSVVIGGWIFNVPLMKSVLPGLVTMKMNTAVCFVLSGLALWILQPTRSNRAARIFGRGCFGVSAVIAGLTIFEYLSGMNLGIDQMLIREEAGAILTTHPGRMAVHTAASFLLVALILFLSDLKTRGAHRAAQFLAILGGLVAVLALTGYLYGIKFLYYGMSGFTAMAFHTAVAFFLIFTGAFFMYPGVGLAAIFSERGLPGLIARILVPMTLVIPSLIGWLELCLERTGVISHELGGSFVAMANMALITGCVVWLVGIVGRIEAKREKSEDELRGSEKYLTSIMDSVADPIFVKDREHRWTLWNKAFCEFMGHSAEEIRGKSDYEFFPQEEADVFWAKDEEVFQSGLENVNEEFFTDGKSIRRTIVTKKTLYKNPAGGEYIVGVIRDITDQKGVERSLALQRIFSSAVIENMDAGVVACNERGELVLFNRVARDWHGMDPLSIPQEEWARHYDLYREDGVTSMDIHTVPLARAFRGEKLTGAGMVIAAKGRPKRHVLAYAGPLIGEDGRILGAVAIMHDMTERENAAKEIAERTHELEVFYKASTGREEKILELKEKVRKLEEELKKK